MEVRKSVLSNGIQVVTTERSESAAVAFHIYFGCGGRHERDEVVGVSHALEHMVFKGTPTRSTLDIAREMEGNGASINANTAAERTCYHFTSPVQVFEKVLNVYADAVNNCLLDKDEWSRERHVILEELKMYEDMPRVWVSDLLETTMFNLQVGVIGSKETINSIEPENMRELIDTWYQPGNTVISVAGGVKHEQVVELSENFFGSRFGSSERPQNVSLPELSKMSFVEQVRQTDQVNLSIGFRGYGLNHEKLQSLRVMCNILGGKMSSRLFTEVREKRGLAYSVGASANCFTDAGYVEMKAGVALEKAAEATKVILEESAKFKDEEVSDEELSEAKSYIRGNLQIYENSSYFAGRNGSSLMLRNILYPITQEIEDVESVNKQDIVSVAKDIFVKEKMTVAVISEKSLREEIKENSQI
ncbi:MAG: pitrilysin family protein [Nitrospinota bacterium]|nr:pitrilysin family protein [Nitrospinota bacterium]